MDGNASGEQSDNIDWDTEDEQEIQNFPSSPCTNLTNPGTGNIGVGEASSSTSSCHSKLMNHFVGMGFPEKIVGKAIQENGEGNTEAILETLLTYSALDPQQQEPVDSDYSFSEYDDTFVDDLSDSDSWSGNAENTGPLLDTGKTMLSLTTMGFQWQSIDVMATTSDAHRQELPERNKPKPERMPCGNATRKRKHVESEFCGSKKRNGHETMMINGDNEPVRVPRPMVGYGVPRGGGPNIEKQKPSGGSHRATVLLLRECGTNSKGSLGHYKTILAIEVRFDSRNRPELSKMAFGFWFDSSDILVITFNRDIHFVPPPQMRKNNTLYINVDKVEVLPKSTLKCVLISSTHFQSIESRYYSLSLNKGEQNRIT